MFLTVMAKFFHPIKKNRVDEKRSTLLCFQLIFNLFSIKILFPKFAVTKNYILVAYKFI